MGMKGSAQGRIGALGFTATPYTLSTGKLRIGFALRMLDAQPQEVVQFVRS